MKILEILNKEFGTANYLNKIIYINVIIFLVINILSVFSSLFLIDFASFSENLMLPSNTSEIIKRPWSILTYMFLHESFIYCLICFGYTLEENYF